MKLVRILPRRKPEKILQGALAWCNKMRRKEGMEPLTELPKGKQGDPASCPCGKATGLSVERERYFHLNVGLPSRRLPMAVRNFVYMFDSGEFPELIEEWSPND